MLTTWVTSRFKLRSNMLSADILHRAYAGSIPLVRIGMMLQKYEKLEQDTLLFILDRIKEFCTADFDRTELCLLDDKVVSLLRKDPTSCKMWFYDLEAHKELTEVPPAFRVAVYNLGSIQSLSHEKQSSDKTVSS